MSVSISADDGTAAAAELADPTPPQETAIGDRGENVHFPAEPAAALGRRLYDQHCAACHGERGDGQGIAATFLFPKPRDLRAGRFRLVSTDNNVPTREDLHAVLLRGMPGSSMPPWRHLDQQQRDALVDEIMRIRRDGATELYVSQLKEDEELTDEEIAADDDIQQEIQEFVEDVTTPGESTEVPAIAPPSTEAIARGKEHYTQFGCVSCHGETGRGDGVQSMFDDEQMPTAPRDFTLGIFKGDPEPVALYRRIAYGMPGTPMPSANTMTAEQMVDLAHFLRSLSTKEQRQAAVMNRTTLVACAIRQIPESELDPAWSRIAAVQPRMMPLWWRDDADPHLTVQAVHDTQNIAIRLCWRDESHNAHALESQSFEDAAAIEIARGDAEPFLGMGDPAAPVDVWFWDADRQRGEGAADSSYPNTVVDLFPFSEAAVATAEMDRPGTRMADQPDVSLPARASGNLIVPSAHEAGGSSLRVGGPGSVTFRVPQSPLVRARGTWKDGQWTVMMTRPLAIANPEDGVSLASGGRASVAFAVWDGAHQDRAGQKSITIWQDLEVE